MAHITYFPRYSTRENVVTHTTLHLLSQIHQHSSDRLHQVLNELLGENEIPLGISFQQQMRSKASVPDGSILQEPVHIIIETKVTAGINIDQLICHCESFVRGRTGNYLMLLTTSKADNQGLEPVRHKAKEIGATFQHITFEELCDSLKGLAEKHETHLMRVIDDYSAYCSEMGLLPDRRKRLRIVPCGTTFNLNKQWHVYYQPTDRSYSEHEYIGIYNQKAVRLLGKVSATYDNQTGTDGQMQLKLVKGEDRPEYRKRIEKMVVDSKQKVGWDISSDMRFFCAVEFLPTDFKKTSAGGIQGHRYWDISEQVEKAGSDELKLAELLRTQTWE